MKLTDEQIRAATEFLGDPSIAVSIGEKEAMQENVIQIDREREANSAFSNYVQSVAFNMTLSRGMIEALVYIRDDKGWDGGKAPVNRGKLFVPQVQSLIRRGLAYHDWVDGWPIDHKFFKLTRAGELMCLLLIEANLIAENRQ